MILQSTGQTKEVSSPVSGGENQNEVSVGGALLTLYRDVVDFQNNGVSYNVRV